MTSQDEPRAGDDRHQSSEGKSLAGEHRDPAGADRGPSDAARVTSLERHARRLLRVYPAAYRRERGDEIIGTLLEASDGRTWPRVRDVRALAIGGLKARGAQNRQRTTSANLRVAIMAGLATYVALWVASYLDSVAQVFTPNFVHEIGWTSRPAAAAALLACATVVLAWTAPRVVVLAAALAASAAIIVFAVAAGGPLSALPVHLLQVVSVLGLAALAPRAGHPSRHWLWLPGVLVISSPLAWFGAANGWFDYTLQRWTLGLPMLILVGCGILWLAIDARVIVAGLTCVAVYLLQMPVVEISSGFPSGALSSLPFLLVVLGIAAPAVWLLRRQSARPVR